MEGTEFSFLVSAIFMSSRELPFKKMAATLTLSPSVKGEHVFT